MFQMLKRNFGMFLNGVCDNFDGGYGEDGDSGCRMSSNKIIVLVLVNPFAVIYIKPIAEATAFGEHKKK
jgi:hypothetical protein